MLIAIFLDLDTTIFLSNFPLILLRLCENFLIMAFARLHRLVAQDIAFSTLEHRFDSGWSHQVPIRYLEELIQKNMHKLLACLLISFLLFFVPNGVLAHDVSGLSVPTGARIDKALGDIVPIRYLPTHPLYFAITIKETVNRFFKPSSVKRAEFDNIRASKRIKEAYLLSREDKIEHVASSLRRYANSIDSTISQIEKARSQNQEVTPLVAKIADNLQQQEVLIIALVNDDEIARLQVLENASSSFKNLVTHMENIMPGVKNRYELLKVEEITDQEISTSATSSSDVFSSPSAEPLRIIR